MYNFALGRPPLNCSRVPLYTLYIIFRPSLESVLFFLNTDTEKRKRTKNPYIPHEFVAVRLFSFFFLFHFFFSYFWQVEDNSSIAGTHTLWSSRKTKLVCFLINVTQPDMLLVRKRFAQKPAKTNCLHPTFKATKQANQRKNGTVSSHYDAQLWCALNCWVT